MTFFLNTTKIFHIGNHLLSIYLYEGKNRIGMKIIKNKLVFALLPQD
jgi:hypothetical protein